jgi:SAM-dependent methyltransferase
MSVDKNLLTQFISIYPHQPATAFWRAIEIAHVASYPFPKGRGLDLGCGDGKLAKILTELIGGGREFVGVDIDFEETAQARKSGIYKVVHTCPADAIPEKDSTFDFVFSNSVLEHIEDIEGVIREVARILKDNGIFIFTVPNSTFHDCLRGSIFPFVSRKNYIRNLDIRTATKRYWSEEEWRRALAVYGLKIESVTYCLSRAEVVRWETISRFTAGILFTLFGGKKHPIEIQRALGLRRTDIKIPKWLAKLLSLFLAFNLRENESNMLYGDLIITAGKG